MTVHAIRSDSAPGAALVPVSPKLGPMLVAAGFDPPTASAECIEFPRRVPRIMESSPNGPIHSRQTNGPGGVDSRPRPQLQGVGVSRMLESRLPQRTRCCRQGSGDTRADIRTPGRRFHSIPASRRVSIHPSTTAAFTPGAQPDPRHRRCGRMGASVTKRKRPEGFFR